MRTTSNGVSIDSVPPACIAPATQWTEPHIAIRDAHATATGQLVVLLPGTGLLPADYELFLTTMAHADHLAIALRYANDKDVGAISDTNDLDCTLQSRLEILNGTDTSPKVDVPAADSVVQRLVGLLQLLDREHAGEGWGSFVSGGQPAWASIIIAGHSLGGGEAALIGERFAVARVLMLSSPNDHDCVNTKMPPRWEQPSKLTPPSRWYGLTHLWDVGDSPLELAAWKALGLDASGAAVNVEKHTPPYGTHELKTDALPATCTAQASCPVNDAHRSTAVDKNTPLDAGQPHFAAVWRFMSGP
jgi:hypothetical protein